MLLTSASPASVFVARAWQNCSAIINGECQLADLSPLEVSELIELDAQLRGQPRDERTRIQFTSK
jgi:hypothetical protein